MNEYGGGSFGVSRRALTPGGNFDSSGVLWFADNKISFVPKFWVSDRQNIESFCRGSRVRYCLAGSVGTIIDQLIFYWQAIEVKPWLSPP